MFLNLYNPILNKIIRQNHILFKQIHTKKSYKFLFFGSDSIALSSLRKVNELMKIQKTTNCLDLVTNNSSTTKLEIEKYAQSENIKTVRWPLQNLQPAEYDMGLIVAFGHLIKLDLLKKFPLGMVNVHPSLLPRWRGAAPIIYTLLHGDEITGVTLMKIKADIFDVGEIISQRKVPISKNIKLPELTKQLSDIGAEMLVECISTLPKSIENAKPQSEEGVTYAKKINKSISEVNWAQMTSIDIYNLYRAIYGLYALSTKYKDKHLKLFNAFLSDEDTEENLHIPVGTVEYCKKRDAIRILCKDRKYIYFKSLRIVGKKEISALDFYNGYIKKLAVEKRAKVIVGT